MIVTAPQPSVAVAEPSDGVGSAGLHPNETLVKLPVKVGGVISAVHITVLEVVAVLLHASLAVKVLVVDLIQPELRVGPSDEVIVTAPHPSVAVAVPNEADGVAGLHPKSTSA